MILGFLFFELHGGSERPLWVDGLTVTVAGLLPLGGGIQLLRRRYETLANTMRLICGGALLVFAFCLGAHLLFPDVASSQLGVIAADGLVASILAGLIWLTAWARWRSILKRKQYGRG